MRNPFVAVPLTQVSVGVALINKLMIFPLLHFLIFPQLLHKRSTPLNQNLPTPSKVMEHSLPDCIHLQYALNPAIRATYTKNKKITFTSPDELKGRVAKNIFEASFIVRNVPSFPYSDWIVTDESNAWTVSSYERSVTTYIKRLKQASDGGNGGVADPATIDWEDNEQKDLVDLSTLPWDQWTSEKISHWICYHQQPPLPLKEISHFRRYGPGLSFEFLCHWNGNKSLNPIMTWQKYSDLQQNSTYASYIRPRWDSKVERERNWEDEIDRHAKEEGFDIILPEVGRAYAIEADTLRGQKIMAQHEKRKRKQKQTRQNPKTSRRFEDDVRDDEGGKSDDGTSESRSTSESDEESDEESKKRIQPPPQSPQEPVVWMGVFDTSSVTPVPRYKIKRFKSA